MILSNVENWQQNGSKKEKKKQQTVKIIAKVTCFLKTLDFLQWFFPLEIDKQKPDILYIFVRSSSFS